MQRHNVDYAAAPGAAAAMFENAVRATTADLNAKGQPRVTPASATEQKTPVAPRQRYDRLSRILHWAVALGIIYTMVMGYALHFISDAAVFGVLSTLNMSIATLVAGLMVVRYVWRFFRPSVSLGDHMPSRQKAAVHMAHDLFYLIIFVVLISGFLMVDHSVKLFFLVELPRLVTVDAVNAFFFTVHRASCIALALMLALHLLAVAKHQLVDKYPVLFRMI